MLNTEHFNLLAGNPKVWDDEVVARVDGGGDLCDVQVDQFNRGRQSAKLVEGIRGWYVRAASNLMSPAVLSRGFDDINDAVTEGCRWANEDPDNREFFALKKDYEK